MFSYVRLSHRKLKPREQCPIPFKKDVLEVWLDLIETRQYTKHQNGFVPYGPVKNRLPTMLRTLADRWSLGGILCQTYKRFGWPLRWEKGYNGKFAVCFDPVTGEDFREEQFLVPRPVLEWALETPPENTLYEDEDFAKVQDFIHRLDCKISFTNKYPTRKQMIWWFRKGEKRNENNNKKS